MVSAPLSVPLLIDTHTHFDVPEFDNDRELLSYQAYQNGVRHLILIGFLAKYFSQMVNCQTQMQTWIRADKPSPMPHLAFGLHPFYIGEHSDNDLAILESFIQHHSPIAIGEIGLDTFTDDMKNPAVFKRQQDFFVAQLDLAKAYRLPALLHIRKSHAETLALLKAVHFKEGGIAHAFSGGVQEAKAFVKLGFKIGITGQLTNPNAKKLRTTISELVKAVGVESLVLETDCPDFTPICCHATDGRRNVPANLTYVLDELSALLNYDKADLAQTIWQNSANALNHPF